MEANSQDPHHVTGAQRFCRSGGWYRWMVGDGHGGHGGHLTPASPGSVEVDIYDSLWGV